MTPEAEKWCHKHKVKLEDGLPARAMEMGPPRPCLRCRQMVECPVDGFLRINGEDAQGPMCDDCTKLMMTNHREFWDGFKENPK